MSNLADKFSEVVSQLNTFRTTLATKASVGELSGLSTTNKTNIVSAINEVKSTIHNVTISTSDPSGGVDGDIWYKV